MSLLADLLSKRYSSAASGGKSIPPTLSQSHDIPAKVRSLKSRYGVIAAVFVTTVVLGVLFISQYKRLAAVVVGKPSLAPQPVKAPVVVAPAPLVPAVITPPPEQVNTEPKPAVATAPRKKAPRSHRAVRAKKIQHTAPVLLAAKPVAPAAPRIEAPSGKIDTAKRDSLLYAARSAEQASDWRLALANYRKAQKIDPDNYVIMNNAAAALNNLGMFDDGVREAKRALGKKPDYVPAMVNAAIAYSSRGNSQEALRLFSEAAIADPGNRSLVINLGILQERTGKLDAAQATYRPLADDGDPLALQGMGRVYERKGNRLEAVRTYRQIMALPNASPSLKREVKGNLVRLEE